MFILLKSGAMFNLFWLQDCFQGKHDKNVVIFYCINGSKVIEEYDTEEEAKQRVDEIKFNMTEASAGDTRPLIVDELPTENISTRRSYLIRVGEDPEDGYQEWRYIELPDGTCKWDMLGVTKDYAYSKEEIDDQFTHYYTKTQIDTQQQTQDTTITNNKTDIENKLNTAKTELQNAYSALSDRVTTNAENISTNANTIAANKDDIESKLAVTNTNLETAYTTLGSRITLNTTAIADNKTDIEGKLETAKTELESADNLLSEQISTNSSNITNLENTKQDTLTQGNNITIDNNVISAIVPTKVSDLNNDSEFIDKNVNNLTNYELKTNTGSSILLSIDSSTYVVTLQLKNSAGTVLSQDTIDLPLETMVVDANYDNTNKKIILTLKNGTTVDFSVADLVSGLQSEITSNSKLSSDLVDDTNNTNKFVTSAEKTSWNNKSDFSGSYNDLTDTPIIPTVPTNISAFTNDSGYLTEHQSLANYYNKDQVNAAIQTAINNITDGDEVSY